jgi:hypothetical protein
MENPDAVGNSEAAAAREINQSGRVVHTTIQPGPRLRSHRVGPRANSANRTRDAQSVGPPIGTGRSKYLW